MSNVPVRSVKKALDLLSILVFDDAFARGMTLSELAAKMDLPTNTAHNLLKTMSTCGFVAQVDGSRYVAGPKCRDIGQLNQIQSEQIADLLHPILSELRDTVDENIVFATLAGGRRIVPVRVDAEQVIAINSDTIEGQGIYGFPTGRVLVAWADERQLEDVISHYGWPLESWDGIKDIASLKAASEPLLNQGHCTLIPDRNDVASFACPVFNADGKLLGALGCYAPMFRCPPEKQAEIINALKQTAERMTDQLHINC